MAFNGGMRAVKVAVETVNTVVGLRNRNDNMRSGFQTKVKDSLVIEIIENSNEGRRA